MHLNEYGSTEMLTHKKRKLYSLPMWDDDAWSVPIDFLYDFFYFYFKRRQEGER